MRAEPAVRPLRTACRPAKGAESQTFHSWDCPTRCRDPDNLLRTSILQFVAPSASHHHTKRNLIEDLLQTPMGGLQILARHLFRLPQIGAMKRKSTLLRHAHHEQPFSSRKVALPNKQQSQDADGSALN